MRTLRCPSIDDCVSLPFDSLVVVARPCGDGVRAAVLADMLGEDLAAALARSPRLRVPCAEFVRPYAKSDLSPEEIGRALNVRGVALCTVAAEGPCVDVVLDLIDVVTEEVVVHDAFLVSAREVPALARAIMRSIPGHGPASSKCGPAAEVIEARVALANGDAEGALEILGASFPLERAAVIVEGRVRERLDEARTAVREIRSVRALQLRAKLAFRFDADWPAAEQALREALEQDPCSPSTRSLLGDLLVATGRPAEGGPHHRIAAELMPLDESAQIAVAFADYFGAFPLQAVPHFRDLGANDWLVRALLAGGDFGRAREAASTPFARALVTAYARDNVVAAPFPPYQRALILSVAGDVDGAVACLESCDDDARFFAAVEPLFLLSKIFPSASHRIYPLRNRSCGGGL